MILTPLNIQVAIIKAWYSIALKSVKYYAGLAVGINNSCLLKQARLLRKYVEILKNFTIVDSTIECSCCIEGDYTVLLNDLSETQQNALTNLELTNTVRVVFTPNQVGSSIDRFVEVIGIDHQIDVDVLKLNGNELFDYHMS
jgi:hypothetical protein